MLALANYLEHGIGKVEGWLSPTAATMIANVLMLQTDQMIGGDVCEIGVHHGRLFLVLANATASGQTAVAVDVFSDQHENLDQSGYGDRAIFEIHLATYAPGAKTDVIQASSLELDTPAFLARRFRFMSIDGGHTTAITLNDLRLAERTVVPFGVVALDDILNPHWTGVIAGLVHYIEQGGTLVPWALVPNKLLLAPNEKAAAHWRGQLARLDPLALEKSELEFPGGKVLSFNEHPYYNLEAASAIRCQRDDLERECHTLRGNVDDLRQEIASLQQGSHSVDDGLQRERDAAVRMLAAVHGSTSWRMTVPLRAIKRLAGRTS